MKLEMNDMNWTPVEIDNEEELTLFGAVCQIVDVASNSQYDPRIYDVAARPIAYITNMLGFTQQQAILYAMMMDMYYDSQISTYDISRKLGISPLKALKFGKDLEELCRRKYLACDSILDNRNNKNYYVTPEAIDSLQQDCPIIITSSKVQNIDEWFSALDNIVSSRCMERISYDILCQRIDDLIIQNEELPMIKQYMPKCKMLCTDDRMLFWWVCSMLVNDDYETFTHKELRKLYDDRLVYRTQRKSLSAGTNSLIQNGLIRIAEGDEQRTKDCFELTPWVIDEMLAELDIATSPKDCKGLIDHSSITPKQLFYNPKEQSAINQLTSLLQPERFCGVRSELQRQGFRSGFACLFYGSPGTGKTETVLQLARSTGRDIMQVNVSEIKSMWVGESEKNIKAIFTRYRELVKESEIAPILFFNEADAIFGKRLENVQRSADKMENSLQNIILEEVEALDGILIATTNLTRNFDTAFERRFIYKIEFEKPTTEAKCAIWQSMITDLSADDATTLATKYDFSGGQIENIARKSIVDRIISGASISLEALCSHCDAELIDKPATYNRIGF